MNDILDIEVILKKQKYPVVYNIGLILIIILLAFIYVAFTYKYQTYYIIKGTMEDGKVKLLVQLNDIKYISSNNQLEIDDINYNYVVEKISDELYIDESLNNYKYIYLKVDSLNNINNYVYEVKVKKEKKKIIDYLKDYL